MLTGRKVVRRGHEPEQLQAARARPRLGPPVGPEKRVDTIGLTREEIEALLVEKQVVTRPQLEGGITWKKILVEALEQVKLIAGVELVMEGVKLIRVKALEGVENIEVKVLTGLTALTIGGLTTTNTLAMETEEPPIEAATAASHGFIIIKSGTPKTEIKTVILQGSNKKGMHLVIYNASAETQTIAGAGAVSGSFVFSGGKANLELLTGELADFWFVQNRWRNSKV